MKAMAVAVSRARKKTAMPKALPAVARQQLLLINGLLDEVARNYVARLHREILELTRALERAAVPGSDESKRNKGLKSIVKKIEHLQIDPERGRRKDLKKIDTLIGQVQAVLEKW
jgi:hypothetical protein